MQIEKGIDKEVKKIRVLILDKPGYMGKVATAIGNAGATMGDIRLVGVGLEYNTRDITVYVDDEDHLEAVLAEIGKVEGAVISDVIDPVLEIHRGGKIRVKASMEIEGISTVRKIYTPGVAKVCRVIRENPEKAHDYTAIYNTVAIVTNGTAILGLGTSERSPECPSWRARRPCSTRSSESTASRSSSSRKIPRRSYGP